MLRLFPLHGARAALDDALAAEDICKCLKDALHVKERAYVACIVAIEPCLLRDLERIAPVHLCPARDARVDVIGPVLVALGDKVVLVPERRPGSHEHHFFLRVKAQHVEDLRQLIEAVLPEEPADPRDISVRVKEVRRNVVRRIDAHRAELVDLKIALPDADPLLAEEDGPRAVELYCKRNEKIDPPEQKEKQQGKER